MVLRPYQSMTENQPNDADKQITVFDALQAEKIEFIQDCMAIALSKQLTLKKFMEKYGGSRSQAYRYYNTAIWEIRQEVAQDRAYHIARSVSRMDKLIKQSIAAGDTRAAIMAEKHRADMLGLSGPVINEPGVGNAADAGRVDPLDERSARDLAEIIARTQAATTDGQHDVVGPEQLQNG